MSPAEQGSGLRGLGGGEWGSCGGGGDARVESAACELKLDLDMADVVDSMEEFQECIKHDVSTALSIPPAALNIKGVRAGSVIVDLEISRAHLGPDKDPRGLIQSLQQQAVDPKSSLRSGVYTCKVEAITLVSPPSPSPPPASAPAPASSALRTPLDIFARAGPGELSPAISSREASGSPDVATPPKRKLPDMPPKKPPPPPPIAKPSPPSPNHQ